MKSNQSTREMKKLPFLFGTILFAISLSSSAFAQDARYPIVNNYGGIYEINGAVDPDSDIHYRIVIDLKTLQSDKERLNQGLNNVARMMNLHGLGGVSKENLSVVIVAHGGATESILNHDGYRRKNDVDNPNIPLIDALKEAGAEIVVCGQSLLARGYEQNEVNNEVTIGLSMLTVVTEHMHKGFQLLVFD
ncbi:DsrE family protein [Rhodohalobacter sp. 8-1]|uniref:DsrE family protein n=1 Tax=Rhodohalobacter sp. 8-1 TaxID=3131972 RepID=UPI0030EE3426